MSADPDILVCRTLPPLRDVEFPADADMNRMLRARRLFAKKYAVYAGLTNLKGLMVSVYWPRSVGWTDSNGEDQTGYAGLMGPKGRPPIVAVILPDRPDVQVIASPDIHSYRMMLGIPELGRDEYDSE